MLCSPLAQASASKTWLQSNFAAAIMLNATADEPAETKLLFKIESETCTSRPVLCSKSTACSDAADDQSLRAGGCCEASSDRTAFGAYFSASTAEAFPQAADQLNTFWSGSVQTAR